MSNTSNVTEFKPQRRNANKHSQRGMGQLEASIQSDGWIGAITVAADGETFDGSARIEVAAATGFQDAIVIRSDGTRPIVHIREDILSADDPRALRLGIAANRVAQSNLEWDASVLTELSSEIDLSAFWTESELGALLEQDASAAGSADEPDTSMPDALFPSDNEWGVPALDPAMQARTVDMPIERWGRMARHGTVVMGGTWHFYTDDYKFSALWDDPAPVPASGCVNAVEPNWSTHTAMPPAIALYRTYQKRYMARWWQMSGVRILVDLNVEPQFDRINLMGVPPGWRAFATRAYDGMRDEVPRHYEIALHHAGTADLLFVVMGGGSVMQRMCADRGWVWIPQENHVVEGRMVAHG